MRTRDEIIDELDDQQSFPGLDYAGKSMTLSLEVLLDIRDMLMPLAHPIYEVDTDKVDMSLFTSIKRTPFSDIVKEVESESKTYSKNPRGR